MKLQGMMDTTKKWVYFKKMNMLLSSTPQQPRLSRRVNSVNSEYVTQYTRVPLNRACGIDELSNSPENSESVEAEEKGSDLLPAKQTSRVDGGSFRLLAESITKFSDIYEKIESSKRKFSVLFFKSCIIYLPKGVSYAIQASSLQDLMFEAIKLLA
ncbi:hypothetical protein DCAR_0730253 [Daucus carota subsp. sativus]|uniref:Uncharacterized protein n=1 Tax=Daucus carota subsp. sativus TaxID=79200 RepID=A0A164URS3_DAUCS|nr:hypothetical protein DCAR_0730253 [Daucus carota subsp. sativus]